MTSAAAVRSHGEFAPHESVLKGIDVDAVSERARIESRNREVHLPPISAFRWWARRTQAVNGAVLDAFGAMYGPRKLVVDPFAGGGTIGLAVISRGHRAYVQDINPWAATGLRTMLGLPGAREVEEAGALLREAARPVLSRAYETTCSDGSPGQIAHTLRVATGSCSSCGLRARLFPYAVLTLLVRKERRRPEAYLACRNGHVFLGRADVASTCTECGVSTDPSALYAPRRAVTCAACGHVERLQKKAEDAGIRWEPVLVERVRFDGKREFAKPTEQELLQAADEGWHETRDLGAVPNGRETSVLLRHGFQRWNDLFPRRQQAVTQALLDLIPTLPVAERAADVLRLAVIGTVEFAGHLSRWDRWYLKCNDATAGHRFNFSTFVPEPNVWGAGPAGRGTVERRLRSFVRATEWLHQRTHRDLTVQYLLSEEEPPSTQPDVAVVYGSSERILLQDQTADLILTDPPYHDDVQYNELSLLFRVWAGLSVLSLEGEAAVNGSTGLNASVEAYTRLLSRIFRECHRVLKRDGRLIFSYANRDPLAWVALFTALQDAGFRAVAYMIVHSENETDYAKRDVRACTRDFVMELVPASEPPLAQWTMKDAPADPETEFLHRVGTGFVQIGFEGQGWGDAFVRYLRRSPFLSATSLQGRGHALGRS
jgi:putative DNA methylase